MGQKLAIIAGGGEAPLLLARHCVETGRAVFVARISGMADPALAVFEGAEFGLGEMAARFKAMKAAGCEAVTMLGVVRRPDFKALKLDARAMLMMPRVLAAAKQGDDAILRVVVEECEKEGFRVIGAEEAMAALKPEKGPLGQHAPDAQGWADLVKAARVAKTLGALDVGQGAVVADGLVLAVEAAEGTDAMLARVAGLPEALRGSRTMRRGVLVKRAKPMQERRIDLPTIGLPTVDGADAAGLAGIAVEAGASLVLNRAALVARADALGLFVVGFDPQDTDA